MNEIFDKITDIIDNIANKNNKLTETIFEKTGIKINVGLIVGGILLVIIVLIFVKAILGFLFSKLV
jgi:hypothetical protein